VALEIARESDMQAKWSAVADKALELWDVKLAEECFVNARDLGSLLLLYTSSGNKEGLLRLAKQAEEVGSNNVAFASLWSTGDVSATIGLLERTGRLSEAVLFSQTYKPSKTRELALGWKEALEKQGKGKAGRLLGIPGQDEELFPEWDEYIKLEHEGDPAVMATNGLIEVDDAETPETNGTTSAAEEHLEAEDGTAEVEA